MLDRRLSAFHGMMERFQGMFMDGWVGVYGVGS